MHEISRLYLQEADFPAHHLPPRTRYVIATTPRSGSTHLSVELWRTGALGAPLEYLTLRNHAEAIRARGSGNPAQYWADIKVRRTSPNGIFGVKLFLANYIQLWRDESIPLTELSFDKVIFLQRRDEVAQTISYSLAMQTQKWFAASPELVEPVYDTELMLEARLMLREQNARWEEIFRKTGVEPLRVYYEDLVEDAGREVQRIGKFIDPEFERAAPPISYRTTRQSDARSAEWKRRLSRDLTAIDRLDAPG